MTCGATKGRGGYYLNFWCQNKRKGCSSSGSIRSKVILEILTRIYDSFRTITEEDFNAYSTKNREEFKQKHNLAFKESTALKQLLTKKRNDSDEFIAKNLNRKLDDKERKVYESERKRQANEIDGINLRLFQLEKQLLSVPLKHQELLNLLRNLSVSLKFASPEQKDVLAKNTILNLSVLNGKVVEIRLQEPFASGISPENLKKILFGGPGWD